MIAFRTLAATLALSAFFVRGDVTPSEPGPGSTFNAGSTCRITWQGDTDSRTAWKDMAIELMSGSNLDMEHITTVTTNQDGTKDGSFEYPCPEVTPNSAIYFYQFTSPHTTNKTWTTRFTIASSSGTSTPPANLRQPGSNDPIPWGIGNLVDQSKAVAPPSFTSGNSSSTGLSSTVSSSSRGISTRVGVSTTTSTSSSPSGTSSALSASGSSSGALSVVVDGRIWTAIMTGFIFNALL